MSKPWEKFDKEKPKASASTSNAGPWQNFEEPEKYGKARSALQGGMQSLVMGYVPEIQAAIEPYTDPLVEWLSGVDLEERGYDEAIKDYRKEDADMQRQNPGSYITGQVGGAIAGGLGAGMAARGAGLVGQGVRNAGALRKIGTAGAAGAGTGFLYNPNASEQGSNTDFKPGARFGNAVIGGILGAGSQGLISGAQAVAKGVPAAVRSLKEVDVAPVLKETAPELIEAGNQVGVKPTAGMLHDSTVLRGLESSLEQSPSIPGHLVRKQTKAVREGLQKGLTGLTDDASSLSSYEAGESLKKGIMADVGEKLGPAEMVFDDLRNVTKDIELFPKGNRTDPRKIIARNILKIPEVDDVPTAAWSNEAKQWADAVQNAKTTRSITTIRSAVGQEMRDATGTRRHVLGQIYDKLTNFEENSIKRGAIQSARTKGEGNQIASEMIGQMRGAKKTYRGVAEGLKEFGDVAGLKGTRNPQTFIRSLDSMKSEQLLKKLSNTDDVRLFSTLKEKFPEQFDVVRKKKLSDLVQRSTGKGDMIDVGKFLRNTKSLSPEAKRVLFGSDDAVKKYDAIRKLFESMPEKMGPSGTPQGLQFQGLLNPAMQTQEYARYRLYQFMQTPEGQQRIRYMLNNLDKINPKAIKIEGLLNQAAPRIVGSSVERSRR